MIATLLFAQVAAAQVAGHRPPPASSPAEIIASASAGDWIRIPASDMLVLTLAPDERRRPRQVVIQLMPAPFSQGWVANVRRLASARWWDGTSINRVQDNYVVQWGDASERKPLPKRIGKVPESAYDTDWSGVAGIAAPTARWRGSGRPIDAYAEGATWYRGWPIATDLATPSARKAWPVHCYGMVGVGRDVSPDTGTGAELYAVIGHAPRHLDRNIALVGRVIEGIEHLSSLPRGTGTLGFYARAGERVAIRSIRLATDMPAAQRPSFEYLSTEGATWERYAAARANRRDDFFIRPAGAADICNVPVPVRPATKR